MSNDPMSDSYVRTIEVGKGLSCGCCGDYFYVWEGYVDQDQDNGYGICKDCQGYISDKNEKEYDKIYKTILDGVKPELKARIEEEVSKDPDMKYAWVNHALDKGWVSFGFGPA